MRLPNNYVYVTGGVVPALVKISVQRGNRALDSLTADTVQIPPGQNSSSRFEIQAFDSTGFDTLTASAPGYVTSKVALTPVASRLAQANPGTSHLTTEPPARITTYLEPVNSGVSLKPFAPETVTVVSTDPNVIALDSALTINARGDTATFIVDTTQSYSYYRIRYLGSGSARLKVSAPGFLPDSSPVITVTGPTVHLSFSVQTVGTGQLLQSLYAYVDNIVTGSPLVVNLGKSDSTLPPGSQAFLLSQPTVTIPVNQSSSGYFTITGQVIGSAQLIARATGYSQSVATVSVGQPQLYVTPTLNLYVGAVPATIYVYAEDQNGNGRNVAAATAISDSSTDSTVVAPDSTQLSMATGTSYTSLGIRGKAKGSAEIVFRAANYKSDTMVVSVDTGQLTLNNPPNGLGTGLVAVNQMYVQLPYTTLAALVVSLSSDNTGVLTVPATVTIPAGQSSAYFNVTGVAPGTANVTATAAGARPSPAVPVRISTPMLSVSMSSTSFAGQKQTITVYSRDSVGNYRTPALPLTVTVASSSPTHTAFDSATITIPTTANYAQTGVSFDTSGSFVITASAGGFNSGTAGITVTGAQVTISDFQFTPATVTIPAGQTVTWYNAGPSTHTPTSDANTWSAGTLAAGQRSGAITFSTSGTFTYHCAIHPTMTATVVVQ